MDDHELRELLGLIDADGPVAVTGSVEEPAYWDRLRREITLTATEPVGPTTANATLVTDDVTVVELRPAEEGATGGRGRYGPLLVAAAVIVIGVAGWVLAVDSSQPTVESAAPGTMQAFCRQFPAAGVDTISDLEVAVADLDLSDEGSAERLGERIDQVVAEFDRLLVELPTGGYDDERAGLQTARGSIGQARLELTAGDTDAALRSVGNARNEVGQLRPSVDLDACVEGILGS